MAPRNLHHDPEDDDEENEQYHESSDDDFNPDSAPADDGPSSSEDDEDQNGPAKPTQRKRKRKAAVDDGLDSGDEVTIAAARKTRAKKNKKGASNDDDDDDDDDLILSDDDGEAGLIKTRAQRRVEHKERKPLAGTEGATVDVNALWAQMIAAPLEPIQPHKPSSVPTSDSTAPAVQPTPAAPAPEDEEQIAIRKVYAFAGQRTTEEKHVPRSALAAHLADGWKESDATTAATTAADTPADADADASTPTTPHTTTHRPLRRPSRFDPNPTGFVRALAPEHQLTWPRSTATRSTAARTAPMPTDAPAPKPEKAQKLNVVDKSRLDWTGFVDKEGIAQELDTHGKTKEAYLGRMNFLAGVDARREEELKKARVAGSAAKAG